MGICKKCGVEAALVPTKPVCRPCNAEAVRKWRATHPRKASVTRIGTCTSCGIHGELARNRATCKACWNIKQAEWRQKNLEQWTGLQKKYYRKKVADPAWRALQRVRTRDWWRKLKHEAIMAYGGYRCACCGETEPKFMSIDHIENNGAQHRREVWGVSRWLKVNGYPKGFQVLCMNCNFGKFMNGGVCPHQAEKKKLHLV